MYDNFQKTAWFDCRISTIWFSKFIEGIGNKKLYLTESIVKVRNVALSIYFGELFLCLFRIGLYSIRRFVFSIIVNIVFLILTIGGGYGALVLNPFLVIVHWGGVFIAYVIFIIMMIATLTGSSGDGNGEIFVYYIPLILEAIPLISLLYFNVVVCKFQINYEKMEKLRIQAERNEEINGHRPLENGHRNNINNEEYKENEHMNQRDLEIMFSLEKGRTGSILPLNKNKNERSENKIKNDAEIQESENKICCICYKEEYNSVLIPCGHVCCCINCAKKVFELNKKCPLCKKGIDKYQKIFKA